MKSSSISSRNLRRVCAKSVAAVVGDAAVRSISSGARNVATRSTFCCAKYARRSNAPSSLKTCGRLACVATLRCPRPIRPKVSNSEWKKWQQGRDVRFWPRLGPHKSENSRQQSQSQGKRARRLFQRTTKTGRAQRRMQITRRWLRPATSWNSSQPNKRFDVIRLREKIEQVHSVYFIPHARPRNFLRFSRRACQ